MKISIAAIRKSQLFATGFCLLLAALISFSFKVGKKEKARNAALYGVWMTGEITNPNAAHMKVFNEDGTYYEIHFENGRTIMSHKGMYRVVDEKHYQEEVTNTRFNGRYDLKGNTFTNRYELSKDNQQLILSGTVEAKNGAGQLNWSHIYKRVQIPE